MKTLVDRLLAQPRMVEALANMMRETSRHKAATADMLADLGSAARSTLSGAAETAGGEASSPAGHLRAPFRFFKNRAPAAPRAVRVTAELTVAIAAIAAAEIKHSAGWCWLELVLRTGEKFQTEPRVPDMPAPAIDPVALKAEIDTALGL